MTKMDAGIGHKAEHASNEVSESPDFCLNSITEDSSGLCMQELQHKPEALAQSETTSSPENQDPHSPEDLPGFFSAASATSPNPAWESSDLKAMLSHQLTASMAFDFCANIQSWVSAEENRTWENEVSTHPRSFTDLLTDRAPSLELLILTKEFAKLQFKNPDRKVPMEVAVVLYYTSIAVAFVRLGKWVSNLTKDEAKTGFQWITSQTWVDNHTKEVCAEVIATINQIPLS